MPRRMARLGRLPAVEIALFAAALAGMTVAAILIRLAPIRRIAPHLGQAMGAVGYVPLAPPSAISRARRVRAAIGQAARTVPWRNDCYPQALAGVMLCRLLRIPVAMHLGVRLDRDGEPEAHAWLTTGPVAVTGGAGSASYTPVACFYAG